MILKVVNVQPKDMYLTFEISLKNADLVLKGLGQSEIKYDVTEPETVSAKKAVEELFEDLNEVVEGLEKDGIGP
ncbi:unnamed protein product [marine sediment metagenome]|uniref:Uncharacterized protein n=1 Tax=marine sediment metagenome TaxID=412755 RepID=X0SI22_9ZZZZ